MEVRTGNFKHLIDFLPPRAPSWHLICHLLRPEPLTSVSLLGSKSSCLPVLQINSGERVLPQKPPLSQQLERINASIEPNTVCFQLPLGAKLSRYNPHRRPCPHHADVKWETDPHAEWHRSVPTEGNTEERFITHRKRKWRETNGPTRSPEPR